jgi:hypothetical protein
MYSACASKVIPGTSQRCFKPKRSKTGIGASSEGIDHEFPTTKISLLMLIISCGDSYTEGEGLGNKLHAYPYLLSERLKTNLENLSQSGASEYLITAQVEEAVKKKPDLIVIGHTSEYRWQVWDFRRNHWQGFLVANHVVENEKYYRNWVFSEQILGNKRKNTHEHKAAWHAAGMLYFSEEAVIQRMWSGAVAKQILLCSRANIPVIHHCCFPHLQPLLEELTDDYVKFHLDLEKHKDPAEDGSHAGSKSHLKLAELIMNKHRQIL